MDDIQPRIRQLAADIDRLEAAVAPLLLGTSSSSSKTSTAADQAGQPATGHAAAALHLPLLDKAKLHVLAGFALESTLYCSLGLAGVDARSHAVFRELQRVRQYMSKIDAAEKPVGEPASRLDKAAAIRFVKADLDSPAMKAQLNQLLKEEQAAAAEEAGGPARGASHGSPRGRKRGGPAGGGSSSGGGNLTKRPKHGAQEPQQQQSAGGGSGDGRGRSHPYGRGSRAT